MGAWRQLVNQAGHDFLARAAFSQHEDWNINIGYKRGLGTNLAHGGTGRDKKHIVVKLFHLARQILLIFPQTLINDRGQLSFLERFGQIVLRSQADGLNHLAGVADAGKHYHFQSRHQLAQLLERLQAVNSRHQQVEQNEVRAQALLYLLQGFFAGGCGLHTVVIHFQQGADVAQHSGFVVNQ